MNSKDIPSHLLEPVCELYRKCKNAPEGTRLPALQAEIKTEFPELTDKDLVDVGRITATLVVDQIDPSEREFLRRAAKRVLSNPDNAW